MKLSKYQVILLSIANFTILTSCDSTSAPDKNKNAIITPIKNIPITNKDKPKDSLGSTIGTLIDIAKGSIESNNSNTENDDYDKKTDKTEDNTNISKEYNIPTNQNYNVKEDYNTYSSQSSYQ